MESTFLFNDCMLLLNNWSSTRESEVVCTCRTEKVRNYINSTISPLGVHIYRAIHQRSIRTPFGAYIYRVCSRRTIPGTVIATHELTPLVLKCCIVLAYWGRQEEVILYIFFPFKCSSLKVIKSGCGDEPGF